MNIRRIWPLAPLLVALGCSSSYANRQPLGETLTEVRGTGLDGKQHVLPADLKGQQAILLVGYKQNSQFDIDRWLLGLHDSGVTTPIYEVPTVVGMMPGLFADKIDNGMRSGIPEDLWSAVVTLYDDDADRMASFTGNERPIAARVMLLQPDGRIGFFHDQGFAPSYLRELTDRLE